MLGAALLGGIALVACGGSEDEATVEGTVDTAPAQTAIGVSEGPLSAAGVAVIRRAQEAVGVYCSRVARGLAKGQAPSPRDYERVTAAIDGLAELAAREPEAEAPDGSTPRLALGDIAENLEGTNCDQRLVDRIDQALSELTQ
jgi:hypothetical protein